MTNRDERREIAGDVNFASRQTAKVVVLTVVLVLVLGAVVWAIHVATAGPKGQGDAYAQQQSAANWTRAQAEFNRRYQAVQAQDRNIGVATAALARDPGNTRRQVELDGLTRNCNDAVGEYNSLAREYLSEQFRDSDLPAALPDPNNPGATDCAPPKEK